ncbi:MAG: hypothetical protein MdMp014T_0612 [Treponematales bacterium]
MKNINKILMAVFVLTIGLGSVTLFGQESSRKAFVIGLAADLINESYGVLGSYEISPKCDVEGKVTLTGYNWEPDYASVKGTRLGILISAVVSPVLYHTDGVKVTFPINVDGGFNTNEVDDKTWYVETTNGININKTELFHFNAGIGFSVKKQFGEHIVVFATPAVNVFEGNFYTGTPTSKASSQEKIKATYFNWFKPRLELGVAYRLAK